MAKILKHLGFGKKPPMPPRVDYNLRSYMGLGLPMRCNSESNLLEAVAEERALNKMTHRSQDDTQLVLLPDYSDPADLKEQFRREMGARKKLAASSASTSASLTTDDEFYSTPYETQRLPKGLKLPAMSLPEMRNLLRYTVWNLLTFSPHLRPLKVGNFAHAYRLHMLPDGSEYRIRTKSGTVDGLYRLDMAGDDIRIAGTQVRYKIMFTADRPTYHSAVAPYDLYRKGYFFGNQTSYFSEVTFCVTLDVHTVSGNGSLWYVDVTSVRFLTSKTGKKRVSEKFSGHWYQDTMKRIAATSVFGYRTMRDVLSKILDHRSYLPQA